MKYGVGLACAVMLSLASAANAGNALDKQAFTATPTELLAAAKTVPPGDWPVVVLRDETEVPLALEYARAAVRERDDAPTLLNTLAVAETEAGNLQAAREQGYRAMELDGRVRPTAPDWYLVGRMLEQLGQRKDAIAAYRAIRPEPARTFPTAFSMARDRLKELGVAP